jgi:serine/threonine protein phosphatase PrpC
VAEDNEVRLRAVAAGISDVGLQRDHNEDSFAILNDQELYVVADGMGGHRAGDVASRLATDAIVDFFRATAVEDVTWPFHFDSRLSEEENRLLTGIRIANRQIIDRSTRMRECHGMGTTVVGALFSAKKHRMYIGHVGDSRAYRIRDGEIRLMTRDHSLVNDYLLAMPELTDEQRSELPKNVITRALGMQDHVTVDLQSDECKAEDLYVLCSDGLSGMIDDGEILEVVLGTSDLHEACRRLVRMANEHGGEDNITAVIVRIGIDTAATLGPTGPAATESLPAEPAAAGLAEGGGAPLDNGAAVESTAGGDILAPESPAPLGDGVTGSGSDS